MVDHDASASVLHAGLVSLEFFVSQDVERVIYKFHSHGCVHLPFLFPFFNCWVSAKKLCTFILVSNILCAFISVEKMSVVMCSVEMFF